MRCCLINCLSNKPIENIYKAFFAGMKKLRDSVDARKISGMRS
jgi:hypothetical protein